MPLTDALTALLDDWFGDRELPAGSRPVPIPPHVRAVLDHLESLGLWYDARTGSWTRHP